MKMKRMGAIAACLFAAMQGVCETVDEIRLTADTTVDVAEGVTKNVKWLTGGAYTLTKTGLGTLNIYWTSNENAKVVVEEGTFALRQYPKPTAVFAKAHFHVDASDPSTLVTECVNGTNFVVRWNDASGHTCYATNSPSGKIGRTDPQNRRAFLRSHFQNGLPVVDFGSLASKGYTNEQGVALGYGGAMNWSEPMFKTFREGFTVFSDTEDIYDAARAAYGGYPAAPFASFNYTAHYRNILPGAQFFPNSTYTLPLGRGTNILDIVKFMGPNDAYSNKPSEGFHILNGITTSKYIGDSSYEKYHVDSFAAESCDNTAEASFGGQRIGEYAVFDEYLTAAERMEVSLYLKTKWFPRKFASVEVKSGAAFDASKGGFNCDAFYNDDGAKLLIGCSSVAVNPIDVHGKTIIHFDAAAADTLDVVEVGGTNFVQKWFDRSGNGAYAANMNGDARMPFVNPDEKLNGRPFVDFGSLRTPYNTNDVGEALGYGASLKFDTKKSGVAEGLTVAADTPDVVNGDWLTCPEYSRMHGMSFFSSDDYAYGTGSRGLIDSAGTPKIHMYTDQGSFWKGTNYLDGVKVTNSGSDYTYNKRYPSGFHVFSHAPTRTWTYTHLAEALCKDSGVSSRVYGGQRIAEYALYNPKLTDAERTSAYRALRWKWFAETPASRSCVALSVPEGSSYEVMYETLSVDGPLTLGGKVGAVGVSASNVVVSSSSAVVDAPLTLAPGATLEFERTGDGGFTCLSADSVTAAGACTVVLKADNWKDLPRDGVRIVSGPVSGGSWSVVCSAGAPAAFLKFDPQGVTVSFNRGLLLIYK